jgi:hypothetical protein
MSKEERKQDKAVEKIRESIRKAMDKGVSPSVVSAAVGDALPDTNATESQALEAAIPAATTTARRLPGLQKYSNITLKHGVTDDRSLIRPKKGPAKNTEPSIPDAEKPSLKKLPGKRKPPTLTLKRRKNL